MNLFKTYIIKLWLFSILIVFCSSHDLYAKRPNISDSLSKVLEKAHLDTIKINIINQLSNELIQSDLDSAILYANWALELSRSINFSKGEADALKNHGTINYMQGKYLKAMDKLDSALSIYKNLDIYDKRIVPILQRIGVIHSILGDNAKAFSNFYKAVDIYKSLNDSIGLANTYNNIGIVYDKEQDYAKAIEYYQKSINIRKELGDNQRMSIAMNNIGIIYSKQEKYDMALRFFFNSLKNSKNTDDKATTAITLGNIGNVYNEMQDYTKALSFQYQALEIKKQLKNFKGIAHSMSNIGNILFAMEEYDEAITHHMEALENAKNANDKYLIRNIYSYIHLAFAGKNDYKQALYYAKSYFQANAGINNELNIRNITTIQSKFEKENREREITILQQEKEARQIKLRKTKTIIWSIIIAIIIASILLLFILRSYRQRSRINRKLSSQRDEIELQKEEILNQRNNLENLYIELNHRKEEIQHQHDIIDKKNQYITDSINYAKFIQDALLPQSKELQKLVGDAFIYFEPKDILSGDFYWIDRQDESIYIAIIDSSGHGIPGAFISIIGNNLLQKAMHEKNLTEPQEFLDYLNEGLFKALKEHYNEFVVDSGMDIGIFKINLTNKELTFTGAHNPIYIIRENELIQLKPAYFPLGLTLEDAPKFIVEQQSISLKDKDKIYFYSDGYVDQFGGESNKKYMGKRLRQTLLDIHNYPFNAQKNNVEHIFKEWKGDNEQVDDVLFLGICI